MMIKAILALFLAVPAAAYTNGGGPMYLQIPGLGEQGAAWSSAIRYDLMKLSTAAASAPDVAASTANLALVKASTGASSITSLPIFDAGGLKDGTVYGQDVAISTLPTRVLNQTGASTNDVLTWNGTYWLPAAPASVVTSSSSVHLVTKAQTTTGNAMAVAFGTATLTLASGVTAVRICFEGDGSTDGGGVLSAGCLQNGAPCTDVTSAAPIAKHFNNSATQPQRLNFCYPIKGLTAGNTYNWGLTFFGNAAYGGTHTLCPTYVSQSTVCKFWVEEVH